MKPLWIINKLVYPINDALHEGSVALGKGLHFSDLHWRARCRIRIFNASEWYHWWRYFYLAKSIRHKYRMWLHKHNLRCRCVTYHQTYGVHTLHCPKFRKMELEWSNNKDKF